MLKAFDNHDEASQIQLTVSSQAKVLQVKENQLIFIL